MSTGTTHDTAKARFVEATGVEFAYHRAARPAEVLPLVMRQHFRPNLESQDPALTNAFAAERELIPVDYPGIGFWIGGFVAPEIALPVPGTAGIEQLEENLAAAHISLSDEGIDAITPLAPDED